MKPIRTLTGNTLMWKQPKFSVDHFELRQDDDLYSELYWTGWLSDRAIGQCNGQWWTFDRLGFFRYTVQAMIRDSEQEAARLEFGLMNEGDLCLADGRVLYWRRTAIFANTWTLFQSKDNPLFEIEHGMRWFKQEAWVTLHTSTDYPELPLLLCLALYLVACANDDTAGAVAATTSAACS